jgi:hypothetical protein
VKVKGRIEGIIVITFPDAVIEAARTYYLLILVFATPEGAPKAG